MALLILITAVIFIHSITHNNSSRGEREVAASLGARGQINAVLGISNIVSKVGRLPQLRVCLSLSFCGV